jgi:hypothetical protein
MGPEAFVVQGAMLLPLNTRVIVELHLFIPVSDAVAKRGIPRVHAEVASADAKAQTMNLRISKGALFDPKYWDEVLDAVAKSAVPARKY